MRIPCEKQANKSSTSHFPVLARAGPGSPKPLSKPRSPPYLAAGAPRGRASERTRPSSFSLLGPRPPTYRCVGGWGLPLPPAAPPRRAPSGRRAAALRAAPPPAGGFAVPRPVPPGSSLQPTSREGGGKRRWGGREGGERGGRKAGERRGAAWSPYFPESASQERALRGSLGPSRTPLPRTSSCSSPGTPRPLAPEATTLGQQPPPAPRRPHPQLSGFTPGTRSSPHPFFLPSFPCVRPLALPLQVSLPGPDCLRPLLCPPAPRPAPSLARTS